MDIKMKEELNKEITRLKNENKKLTLHIEALDNIIKKLFHLNRNATEMIRRYT